MNMTAFMAVFTVHCCLSSLDSGLEAILHAYPERDLARCEYDNF
jgi:hypothetical protein